MGESIAILGWIYTCFCRKPFTIVGQDKSVEGNIGTRSFTIVGQDGHIIQKSFANVGQDHNWFETWAKEQRHLTLVFLWKAMPAA